MLPGTIRVTQVLTRRRLIQLSVIKLPRANGRGEAVGTLGRSLVSQGSREPARNMTLGTRLGHFSRCNYMLQRGELIVVVLLEQVTIPGLPRILKRSNSPNFGRLVLLGFGENTCTSAVAVTLGSELPAVARL